jgi:peptide/nickel transport system permease protein
VVLGLVLRRLALAAATLFAVVTITFLLAHAAPGAPMLGGAERRRADPEAMARQRARFGLDRPIATQYALYLRNLASFDLGESFVRRRPVAAVIGEALPNTLLLGGAALALAFALGLSAGIAQALWRGGAADRILGALSVTAYSTPSFWLGLLLLMVFGEWLGWLPTGGMTEPVVHESMPLLGRGLDVARHLALPALTLALVNAATVARFQRAALADALASEFVRSARARGLPGRAVVLRHALRASVAPAITIAGLLVAVLLTGSVLVESVFGWPGMGRVTYEAIFARDYNVITGAALVAGALVAAGSLAADLALILLDPRHRRSDTA